MSHLQLMATLTQVGGAGFALAEVLSLSCFIHAGPLCAGTNAMPRSAPALPSICTTVSRPLMPSGFRWEHIRRHAIAYSERLADSGTSGGPRAEYEVLLVFASRQDMARGAHGWISGAAKQLLELRCGLSWVLSATNQKLGRPLLPHQLRASPGAPL